MQCVDSCTKGNRFILSGQTPLYNQTRQLYFPHRWGMQRALGQSSEEKCMNIPHAKQLSLLPQALPAVWNLLWLSLINIWQRSSGVTTALHLDTNARTHMLVFTLWRGSVFALLSSYKCVLYAAAQFPLFSLYVCVCCSSFDEERYRLGNRCGFI